MSEDCKPLCEGDPSCGGLKMGCGFGDTDDCGLWVCFFDSTKEIPLEETAVFSIDLCVFTDGECDALKMYITHSSVRREGDECIHQLDYEVRCIVLGGGGDYRIIERGAIEVSLTVGDIDCVQIEWVAPFNYPEWDGEFYFNLGNAPDACDADCADQTCCFCRPAIETELTVFRGYSGAAGVFHYRGEWITTIVGDPKPTGDGYNYIADFTSEELSGNDQVYNNVSINVIDVNCTNGPDVVYPTGWISRTYKNASVCTDVPNTDPPNLSTFSGNSSTRHMQRQRELYISSSQNCCREPGSVRSQKVIDNPSDVCKDWWHYPCDLINEPNKYLPAIWEVTLSGFNGAPGGTMQCVGTSFGGIVTSFCSTDWSPYGCCRGPNSNCKGNGLYETKKPFDFFNWGAFPDSWFKDDEGQPRYNVALQFQFRCRESNYSEIFYTLTGQQQGAKQNLGAQYQGLSFRNYPQTKFDQFTGGFDPEADVSTGSIRLEEFRHKFSGQPDTAIHEIDYEIRRAQ